MATRYSLAAILGVGLLAVHSAPGRCEQAGEANRADEAQPMPSDEQIVARIIARIHSEELNRRIHANEEIAWVEAQLLIERLGSFPHRPEAIRAVIDLIGFKPPVRYLIPMLIDHHSQETGRERADRMGLGASFQMTSPDPIQDYPAIKVLFRMGPVVSQYLVDDYVRRFVAAKAQFKDPTFVPRRLVQLVIVLAHDHRLAPPAVVHALRRLADEKDATARQAYQTLIDEVIGEFPEAKRAELFPPEALRK
jgi:hypothetical protein